MDEQEANELSTAVKYCLSLWEGRKLAVQLLRQQLLELGYLSFESSAEAPYERVVLSIVVPLRYTHTSGIKCRMNAMKSYASRQERELSAHELNVISEYQDTLHTLEAGDEDYDIDPQDLQWFDRDSAALNSWLLRRLPLSAEEVNQISDRDFYFLSHLHFTTPKKFFSETCQHGMFHYRLLQAVLAHFSSPTGSKDISAKSGTSQSASDPKGKGKQPMREL
eukprot:Clim_evm133s147 gene=Clim_evmTU133s147